MRAFKVHVVETDGKRYPLVVCRHFHVLTLEQFQMGLDKKILMRRDHLRPRPVHADVKSILKYDDHANFIAETIDEVLALANDPPALSLGAFGSPRMQVDLGDLGGSLACTVCGWLPCRCGAVPP